MIDHKPEAVRVKLLGGFSVRVGSRTIGQYAWRLRRAAALIKLLALAPNHRLHREQIMDLLWPHLGKRAASNNLRRTLHAGYLTRPRARATWCPRKDGSRCVPQDRCGWMSKHSRGRL